MHIKLGRNLADVGSDETFKNVKNNPRLLVFNDYMCGYICMFTVYSSFSEKQQHTAQIQIMSGFRTILKVVREHNNDIVKVVQYISSLDSFIFIGCMCRVFKKLLVMILQAIIEHSHLLEDKNGIKR